MKQVLSELNTAQLEAVLTENQYVLILAGAGTGKTKALTARIVYLIKEKKIHPLNILAVTFTNKAANEMKERITVQLLPPSPDDRKNSKDTETIAYPLQFLTKPDLLIKTFHSFGAYLLRIESYLAGRGHNFQIYDSDDAKRALKEILKNFNHSANETGSIMKWIQEYKQKQENIAVMNYKNKSYQEIYEAYNQFLKNANCFDFEDLILQPIKIFQQYPMVLEKYQRRFRYILVDEYQDTNNSQFELLKLLTGSQNHLMVVGDEDQSIYKFRGADIGNILNFAKDFPESRIIRLEENYRSTRYILDTANTVIRNNQSRLGKNLYSTKEQGNKILVFQSRNDLNEAEKIISVIRDNEFNPADCAILFRLNNQSRALEQIFNREKVPYILVGTLSFFEREEIKDALSILKWLINPKDQIAFSRFINKPARGIGEKALSQFFNESLKYEDLYQSLMHIADHPQSKTKTQKAFQEMARVFQNKDELINQEPLDFLAAYYLKELNLIQYYEEKDKKENSDKLNNLEEFLDSLKNRGRGREAILSYLEEATLRQPSDETRPEDRIKLLTIHNAKGLEFDHVFICGVEEELFPYIHKQMNGQIEENDLEEERRLFYVAITRAKKNLIISFCDERQLFGKTENCNPSLFIKELPDKLIELHFLQNNVKNRIKINYQIGDIVRHKDYGKGKILKIKMINGKYLALIDFWDYSQFELFLDYTKLEKEDPYE